MAGLAGKFNTNSGGRKRMGERDRRFEGGEGKPPQGGRRGGPKMRGAPSASEGVDYEGEHREGPHRVEEGDEVEGLVNTGRICRKRRVVTGPNQREKSTRPSRELKWGITGWADK